MPREAEGCNLTASPVASGLQAIQTLGVFRQACDAPEVPSRSPAQAPSSLTAFTTSARNFPNTFGEKEG